MTDQIERMARIRGIILGAFPLCDVTQTGAYCDRCEELAEEATKAVLAALEPEMRDAERLSVLCDQTKTYWVEVRLQPNGATLYSGTPQSLRTAIDAAIGGEHV